MDDIVGILKGAAGLAADANAFREFFNWAAPRVLAAVRSQQQQHLLQVDPGGVGSASARDNRTAPLHQIEDDLQNLENDLWLIQSTTSTMYDLIDRLEWHSHKDTEDWHLRQIKDVAYDAEDLLDEYNYYALKVKVDTSKNLGQDHSHEPFLEFLNSVNFSKVMKIKNRLKQVFDQSKGLGFHKTPKKFDRLVRPETCRVLDEPDEIFGREKELKELKQKLGVRGRKRGRPVACSTTAEARRTELPVLPIVGMGGIGKTTMAQQICEDRVVRNHFDCILWICVSDEFEVNRLTRDVLKSLGVKSQDSDTRDTLMVNLRDSVKSKKFLLVLDDMWDDVLKDERGWRTFHRTLSNGLQGSMILVTTRSSKVANLVSNSDPYELNGLQNDVFWDFFKLCAFGSNSSRNSPELEHIRPELERIGRAILPKLKGSPLAAKTLGRLLKSNLSVEHWEDILRSELWKLEQEETDILPALRLSYVYLPRHMKRCFSICALYPKDHKFDKEFLADIWVAQGYVEAEDASSCFNDLVNRSFFQKAAGYSDMYVIHDLIHDTAQLVSKDECFIIQHVSDLAKIPSKTINAKGCVFKRYPQGFSDLISLNKIESKGFQFNKVKDKQFLEWSTTEIADEQLQMTEEQIELLPHWNLEHLIIKNYLGQSCPSWLQPDCLKVLTSLELYGCRNIQSLSFFDPLFSDLEESNSIYHLEVLDVHQCPNIDWQGLVALPSSLRRVTLGNFGHSTDHFVSCFRGLSLLTHLEIHCWFLTSIPLQVWMSNLPSLENLRIDNCGSLTSICVSEASNIHTVGVFSSLSTVTISFCNALLSLDEFFMPAYMPFVKTIDVLFCKELALLPVHELHLFSRLEKLCIRNCPKLNMQRRMTLPSSLRMLSLLLCPSIEYIDNSHLASAMKLKGLSLQLMRCPDLISIVGAISVSEIVQGRIEDCPKLMEITQPFKVMTESQKKVQPDQTMGRLGDENLKN
ncbi:Os04g0375300 [Oryza sativa Japonica Group]|uniref:Os04g0375300 protein n=1 Tax=Oryza sativa subsp. japonica TaxID=39947 RepID=A0A0P0W974_ORYSJ|nr:Os04g0375300 [Oryza sativa Japonica Group]